MGTTAGDRNEHTSESTGATALLAGDRTSEPRLRKVKALHKNERAPARRGLWAFGLVAVGMIVAPAMGGLDPAVCFGAACVALIPTALMRGWWCRCGLGLAVVWIAIGAWSMQVARVGADSLAVMVSGVEQDGIAVAVEGMVIETPRDERVTQTWPEAAWRPGPSVRFEMAVSGVGDVGGEVKPASGRVNVVVNGVSATAAVRAGARVRVTGELHAIEPPRNPGQRDARLLAMQDGAAGTLRVETKDLISVIELPATGTGEWIAGQMRNGIAAMRDAARRALEEPGKGNDQKSGNTDDHEQRARAMVSAMLLGVEEEGLRPVNESFVRLGLVHALSISGFHLAVLAAATMLALRLLGDFGRAEGLIVGAVIGAYVLIVPAEAPVVRSAIMIGSLLLASAFGRRHDRLNMLAWTAAGLALWRPMDLWNVGYQLSFGVTAALLWITPWTARTLMEPPLKGVRRTPLERGWLWLKGGAVTSFATALVAWLVSLPTAAYHTGIVSPMSIVGSLIALPGITLTLVAAYLQLALGLLSQVLAYFGAGWLATGTTALASVAAWVTRWLGIASLWVCDGVDALPGSAWYWPGVPVGWVVLSTASIAAALRWPSGRWRWAHRAGLLASVVWLGAIFAQAQSGPGDAVAVRVDEFDVGSGRCVLVRSGSELVVIDAGSSSPVSAQNIGLVASRGVRALGGWRVERLVLTRASADRASAALSVIDRLGVREVIIGQEFDEVGRARPAGAAAVLLRELRRRGVLIRVAEEGDELGVGRAHVCFGASDKGEVAVSIKAGGMEVVPAARTGKVRGWRWTEVSDSGEVRTGVGAE